MQRNQETIVAVVATRPETVLADYARLLRLAGLAEPTDVAGERRWHLVPPPIDGRPGPAATCPPWQLEGVVGALLDAGHRPEDIVLATGGPSGGDRHPLRNWQRVLRGRGMDDVVATLATVPADSARLLLANLRTDGRLGLAGSVAAQAGATLPDLASADLDEAGAELAKVWPREAATVAGAVIDATVVGDGRHGSALMPVAAHLLLAGRDPLAVDAVACRLAGLDPGRVAFLAPLAGAGLGCIDLAAISLVGDTAGLPASLDLVAARRFRAARTTVGPRWWRRWGAAAAARWPRLLTRRRARRRYENQPWGKLHAEYDRRGTIGGGER